MRYSTRMTPARIGRLLVGFQLADTITKWQYPFERLTGAISLLVQFYCAYVGTHVFQGTYDALGQLRNLDYFLFVIIGYLVFDPCRDALTSVAPQVYIVLMSGRLATNWNLPQPRCLLLLEAVPAGTFVRYVRSVILLLVLTWYKKGRVYLSEFVAITGSLALCMVAFFCLGLLAASILLLIKRGDFLAKVLTWLSTYAAGVFVPVDALPNWIQTISPAWPLTHALMVARHVVAMTPAHVDVPNSFLLLAVFGGVAALSGVLALRFSTGFLLTSGAMVRY